MKPNDTRTVQIIKYDEGEVHIVIVGNRAMAQAWVIWKPKS